MKIENEFIPYTEALALKELGFDEPCLGWMADWNKQPSLGKHEPSHHHKSSCNAITWQSAFRWFREKHDLYSCIMYSSDGIIKGGYSPMIDIMKPHKAILDFNNYDTFEEAELACLKKLIEIVKEK
jgi:hypothetical protein